MEWVSASIAFGGLVVAGLALLVQRRSHEASLRTQRELARDFAELESQRIRDERTWTHAGRVWERRADLYARIIEAVRAHVEHRGQRPPAPEDPRLVSLNAEADVLASAAMSDLLSRFVYDDPSDEDKVDLWGELQSQARSELIELRDSLGE